MNDNTSTDQSKPRLIKPKEAAKICGKKEVTIRRWIREGFLPAFKGPAGQYEILYSDIPAFYREVYEKGGEIHE